MLSQKLTDEFNEQINKEIFSEYLYLSMSAYAKTLNLDGAANWFMIQAQEERFHVMKFFNYINDRGGRVILKAIDAPQTEFSSLVAAFEYGLKHECTVTARINHLMNIAQQENDHASKTFLHWFITEQVEEEASFEKVISKLKLGGSQALFLIDNEMGQRVFTPPAGA